MCELSLCSVMSSVFSCLSFFANCAFEHSVVVLVASCIIAALMMSNVHFLDLMSNAGLIACQSTGYDYGPERGPHAWTSSGPNQSPININTGQTQFLSIQERLKWNHYDDIPTSVMIENNGHTVVLKATFAGNTPTISGSDLFTSYTFVELCFRWSYSNLEGSEHSIDFKKYPMEMQVMHRTGPNACRASSYDLLMLGFFFETSTENPFMDPVVMNLHRIRKAGSKIEIPPFPLSWLLHPFKTNFFSYGGSLTEPPCYEGAEWFIFPEPLAISESQLNEFRSLLAADGTSKILRNSRPIQNVSCSRIVNLNQYNPMPIESGECLNEPIRNVN